MLWTGQAPHLPFHTHTGALWGPRWVNQGHGNASPGHRDRGSDDKVQGPAVRCAGQTGDSQLGWMEQDGGRFHQATQDIWKFKSF